VSQRYSIEFSKGAARFMKQQDQKTAARILVKIEGVANDPYAPNNNVKKLIGRDGYRLRVGDIRVIYDVYDRVLVVDVLEIGYRGSVY